MRDWCQGWELSEEPPVPHAPKTPTSPPKPANRTIPLTFNPPPQPGDEFFSFIVDCKAPKACSIVLRGASKDVLNEVGGGGGLG